MTSQLIGFSDDRLDRLAVVHQCQSANPLPDQFKSYGSRYAPGRARDHRHCAVYIHGMLSLRRGCSF
jgi:hypothetical protein